MKLARYVTVDDGATNLGTLAHFCSIWHRNLSVCPPSPQFNVVYRDEVVIARFQHFQGKGGSLFQ